MHLVRDTLVAPVRRDFCLGLRVAAVVGGLLLGYGASLVYGYNNVAYLSGIASCSVHGGLWLLFVFFAECHLCEISSNLLSK